MPADTDLLNAAKAVQPFLVCDPGCQRAKFGRGDCDCGMRPRVLALRAAISASESPDPVEGPGVTEAQVAEMARLYEGTTPGEWRTVGDIYIYSATGMKVADIPIEEREGWLLRARGVGQGIALEEQEANLNLIVALRNNGRALLSEVSRLRARPVVKPEDVESLRLVMLAQSDPDDVAALSRILAAVTQEG